MAEARGGPVVAGHDAEDAGERTRGRRIDAADAGVGVRRAHERGVGAAGDLDVVDEPSLPGEEAGVLDPLDPLSDVHRRRRHQPTRFAMPVGTWRAARSASAFHLLAPSEPARVSA